MINISPTLSQSSPFHLNDKTGIKVGGAQNATSGDDTYWSWRNPCEGPNGRLSVYRSYVHNYQSWQAAKDICEGVFGGGLASPSTQCESTFLRTMMMEYYGAEADAWIGLVKGK